MEAVLRQVEVDLANTDIRSPVNGVIIQRSVELGQTVAASLQSPTIFTIADDLRRMEIAVSIDETDVGRVKPGQRVVFSVSAYPGREFEGKVKHVRLGSQTVSNVVTYTGIVSIENPKMELLPGMTASVKIEAEFTKGRASRAKRSTTMEARRAPTSKDRASGYSDPMEVPGWCRFGSAWVTAASRRFRLWSRSARSS